MKTLYGLKYDLGVAKMMNQWKTREKVTSYKFH